MDTKAIQWPSLIFVALCILLWSIGCQNPEKPAPSGYYLSPTEVTNGVAIVFPSDPPGGVVLKIEKAGGIKTEAGWAFDIVNTQEKRDAITAALLAGAELKGTRH